MDGRIENAAETPLTRLRAFVQGDRLDIAAVVCMVCTLAVAAAEVYVAFRAPIEARDAVSGWQRAVALAQTTNLGFAATLAVGLAICAAFASRWSRVAATLGLIGGAWVTLSGVIRICYELFDSSKPPAPPGVETSDLVVGVAITCLGLLLVAAAWRIATVAARDDAHTA